MNAGDCGSWSDMGIRVWVRLDVGLLDDDRFEQMSAEQTRAWLNSYLLIARAGDAVKDRDRLAHLLKKQGVDDAADMVRELDGIGWIVDSSQGGITLRGYENAQTKMRWRSDDPAEKAQRNAKRPTTRAGRRGASGGAGVEHRGAGVERVERHKTRQDKQTTRADARETTESPKSLKELLKENGYDPTKTKPDSTS